MRMNYDDINSMTLDLWDFLIANLGIQGLDDDLDYLALSDKMFSLLDKFSTGDYGNYN